MTPLADQGDPAEVATHRRHVDANRQVAAELLRVLAVVCLVVAGASVLVMFVSWLSAGRNPGDDLDWPGYGWLLCIPALAASCALAIAAEQFKPSRPSGG